MQHEPRIASKDPRDLDELAQRIDYGVVLAIVHVCILTTMGQLSDNLAAGGELSRCALSDRTGVRSGRRRIVKEYLPSMKYVREYKTRRPSGA